MFIITDLIKYLSGHIHESCLWIWRSQKYVVSSMQTWIFLFIHTLNKTQKHAILIDFSMILKKIQMCWPAHLYYNSCKSNSTKTSQMQQTYINNILTTVCGRRCTTEWEINSSLYHRGMAPVFWANAIAFSFAKIWNSWNLCEIRWFILRYFSIQFRAHLSYRE